MVGAEHVSKRGDEAVDVLRLVVGAEGEPQSGGALWNGRGADRLHVPAAGEELGGDRDGPFIAAQHDGYDRCDGHVRQTKGTGEVLEVLAEPVTCLVSGPAPEQVKAAQDRLGDPGTGAGAVDEASGPGPDPVARGLRAGHECTCTPERFAQRTYIEGGTDAVGLGPTLTTLVEAKTVGIVHVDAETVIEGSV